MSVKVLVNVFIPQKSPSLLLRGLVVTNMCSEAETKSRMATSVYICFIDAIQTYEI